MLVGFLSLGQAGWWAGKPGRGSDPALTLHCVGFTKEQEKHKAHHIIGFFFPPLILPGQLGQRQASVRHWTFSVSHTLDEGLWPRAVISAQQLPTAMEPAALGVLGRSERVWVTLQGAQTTARGFKTRMRTPFKRAFQ